MNITEQMTKDIRKEKRKLIAKAKRKGLFENFGQAEVRKLEDKYFDYMYKPEIELIRDFDRWCMTYEG